MSDLAQTQADNGVIRPARQKRDRKNLEAQKPKIEGISGTVFAEIEALESGINKGIDDRVAQASDRIVAKIQGAPLDLVRSVLGELQGATPETEFFRGVGAEIIKAL